MFFLERNGWNVSYLGVGGGGAESSIERRRVICWPSRRQRAKTRYGLSVDAPHLTELNWSRRLQYW